MSLDLGMIVMGMMPPYTNTLNEPQEFFRVRLQ